MADAVTILKAARELISTPEKWTKRAYARDADGNAVHSVASRATCFCTLGAVYRAIAGYAGGGMSAAKALGRETQNRSIPEFNDHPDTTHADVLALFDRAIANLEAEKEPANG